jgi:putative porin
MLKRLALMLTVFAALGGRPAPARAEMSTEQRLRALEQALGQAQQEIKRLREEVRQQKAINQGTQTQVEETRKSQEEQAKVVETAKKGLDMPGWVKQFTPFGDIRYRHEGFYNQPHADGQDVTARNRERIRARVGLKYTYSDELSATIRLASGNPDDPISTNETLTGDFTRKHINLDWAYLTFTPGKSFGVRPGVFSVNAGKFPNPVFRVGEMLFDDDLSPEGLSETVAVLDKPIGPLDQLKLYMNEWVFNEVSNAQDGWMFGGQVNPQGHIGNVQLEAGVGQYWWLNSDQIAQALNTNKALTNTNLTDSTTSGGKTTITAFKSAFNETNVTLAATIPNVVAEKPLRAFTDYVYNWEAATDDAQGVQAGLKLGQTKVQGDWAVTGFYEYLGQEAALSEFTYSDFGLGGTNQQGPVLAFDYQLLNPLTITLKNHFTNFINRPAGMTNPTLFRLQLDALVKF